MPATNNTAMVAPILEPFIPGYASLSEDARRGALWRLTRDPAQRQAVAEALNAQIPHSNGVRGWAATLGSPTGVAQFSSDQAGWLTKLITGAIAAGTLAAAGAAAAGGLGAAGGASAGAKAAKAAKVAADVGSAAGTAGRSGSRASQVLDWIIDNPAEAAALGLAGANVFQSGADAGRSDEARQRAASRLDLAMNERPDLSSVFADPGNPYQGGGGLNPAQSSALDSLTPTTATFERPQQGQRSRLTRLTTPPGDAPDVNRLRLPEGGEGEARGNLMDTLRSRLRRAQGY